MTVRRWLLDTAAIDTLTEMNNRLRRRNGEVCVCSAVFDIETAKRCEHFGNDCNNCIQSMLNEQK